MSKSTTRFALNITCQICWIQDLIELGAETFVVPGNLPIGCSTTYLTLYYGSDKVKYDNTTGCLIELNKFAEYHNELLQMELNQIRELHPNVNVIYGDYYNAALQFFSSPKEYGNATYSLKWQVKCRKIKSLFLIYVQLFKMYFYYIHYTLITQLNLFLHVQTEYSFMGL